MTDKRRWINVVWCDDIRHEVGNKPSLMGVYTSGLVVPAFPAVLPRLGLWISVYTPIERPFGKFSLSVKTAIERDPPVLQMELDSDQVAGLSGIPPNPSDPLTYFGASAMFMIGPVNLTADTKWLKVFVQTEDELLESLKLRLQSAAEGAARPLELPKVAG